MRIRAYREKDQSAVIGLWHRCGLIRPWNDPAKDIARKLRVQGHMFLVGVIDDRIVGSVMAGYDGHRGWIYYLAIAPHVRARGLGRSLVSQAESLLRAAGCPKINLQIRTDNEDVIAFYRALGYTVDSVVGMGKRLDADDT